MFRTEKTGKDMKTMKSTRRNRRDLDDTAPLTDINEFAVKKPGFQHGQTASSEKAPFYDNYPMTPHPFASRITVPYTPPSSVESTLSTRKPARPSAESSTNAARQTSATQQPISARARIPTMETSSDTTPSSPVCRPPALTGTSGGWTMDNLRGRGWRCPTGGMVCPWP